MHALTLGTDSRRSALQGALCGASERRTSIHMNHEMCGCLLTHICRRKTFAHAAGWTRLSACAAAVLAQSPVDSSGYPRTRAYLAWLSFPRRKTRLRCSHAARLYAERSSQHGCDEKAETIATGVMTLWFCFSTSLAMPATRNLVVVGAVIP